MNPELLPLLLKAQAAAENLIRVARNVKSYRDYLIQSMEESCEKESFIAECRTDFANLGETIIDAELSLIEVSRAVF